MHLGPGHVAVELPGMGGVNPSRLCCRQEQGRRRPAQILVASVTRCRDYVRVHSRPHHIVRHPSSSPRNLATYILYYTLLIWWCQVFTTILALAIFPIPPSIDRRFGQSCLSNTIYFLPIRVFFSPFPNFVTF